jgi:hypothetical protein
MDLKELKRIRKENILAHKRKKREYYLRKKLQESSPETSQSARPSFDYEKELNSDFFAQTIKDIAKKQKSHVDSRKEIITQKIVEYKEQKQKYYEENREKRLQYDKEYREKKKEKLKAYRKEYYQKNREKILQKQKEKRKLESTNGK